jgi:hypothetical protein
MFVPTYILTWNPTKTEWDGDLSDDAERTAQGISISTDWSTGHTKRIQPGDRLFLLKQGPQPKGIFGIGVATSKVRSSPHWNEEGKLAKESRQNNLPNSLINGEGGFHSSIRRDIGSV